jgi:pimeloyl-ACP methyl ester carboxylesterase
VDEWLKTVDEPVLVAHGTADTTIGVQHGRRVHELARNKDELWIVDGAGHGDLWDKGLWDHAKAFFEKVEAEAAT